MEKNNGLDKFLKKSNDISDFEYNFSAEQLQSFVRTVFYIYKLDNDSKNIEMDKNLRNFFDTYAAVYNSSSKNEALKNCKKYLKQNNLKISNESNELLKKYFKNISSTLQNAYQNGKSDNYANYKSILAKSKNEISTTKLQDLDNSLMNHLFNHYNITKEKDRIF